MENHFFLHFSTTLILIIYLIKSLNQIFKRKVVLTHFLNKNGQKISFLKYKCAILNPLDFCTVIAFIRITSWPNRCLNLKTDSTDHRKSKRTTHIYWVCLWRPRRLSSRWVCIADETNRNQGLCSSRAYHSRVHSITWPTDRYNSAAWAETRTKTAEIDSCCTREASHCEWPTDISRTLRVRSSNFHGILCSAANCAPAWLRECSPHLHSTVNKTRADASSMWPWCSFLNAFECLNKKDLLIKKEIHASKISFNLPAESWIRSFSLRRFSLRKSRLCLDLSLGIFSTSFGERLAFSSLESKSFFLN